VKITVTPTTPLIPGTRVAGVSVGTTKKGREKFRTAWEGVYVGAMPSEWTGEMMHVFRNGTIGTTPQGMFGFPVSQF